MTEQKTKREYVKNRVSVVTPVFNGATYIHRLLDSVLSQTWNDIEMIVSDDGSTDDTIKVCESYRKFFEEKGYILTIISGEHINASGALGRGLPEITGEYLIWPDGDDELLPNSIKHRVEFLQRNPDYQCVRSLQEYVNYETGEPVKPPERTGSLDTRKLFWDILFARTYVCCGCYMLRSEPFFKIYPSGQIPVYNVGQNFQMLLPFMYKHECPTLQEILYRVNRRDDSHSARALNREQTEEKYALYEKLIDELALISGITSKKELNEIEIWKLNRQLEIAAMFNDKRLEIKVRRKLIKYNKANIIKLLKCYAKIIVKAIITG